jgi:membrane protease YdiL (CAAX protease family)
MEKPEYQPNFFQAILLLLLYFLVFNLVPALFFASLSRVFGFKTDDMLVNGVIMLIGFILLIFWVQRRYRINYQELLAVQQLKILYLVPILLMTAGVIIVISEIQNLVFMILPPQGEWAKNMTEKMVFEGAGIWKFIIIMIIVVPVVEEVIFRGLILRGFITRYPAHRAIAFSALLFGMALFNPWLFWSGIIWGSISGWWFYKTRSLIPCIIGNALLSSSSLITEHFLGLKIPGFSNSLNTIQYQPLWFDAMGIGLLVLGIILLVKMVDVPRINLIAE